MYFHVQCIFFFPQFEDALEDMAVSFSSLFLALCDIQLQACSSCSVLYVRRMNVQKYIFIVDAAHLDLVVILSSLLKFKVSKAGCYVWKLRRIPWMDV